MRERRSGPRRKPAIGGFTAATILASVPWLDEVDAVVVATTPTTHYQTIRTALRCGKHVLTEKPFAMTMAEGQDLVGMAEDTGRVLAIVHNFQFAQSTRRLIRDIERGALGPIRGVVARQYGNPARRLPALVRTSCRSGLFYDESPHLLYLLRRLSPGPLRLLACDVFPSTSGKATPALIQVQYARATRGPIAFLSRCPCTSKARSASGT